MENAKFEEQKAKASKTLATMLDYLGLEAALKTENKGANIAIKISSEDAGRIIGRKGQTLESLQLLLNRMMFNGDKTFPRILLDIDGYARNDSRGSGGGREQRPRHRSESDDASDDMHAQRLEQQALDAAKEVKRWGEPVVLQEMNSHDRRIIHITLQEDTELTTVSEGDGSLKKVIISLKK